MKCTLPILLLMACCLLTAHSSSAQSNYQPGNITLHDGTVKSGLIDYREWTYSPDKISFKSSEQQEATSLVPGDIDHFEILELDEYRSATVSISTAALGNSDKVPVGKDTRSKRETVFLHLITEGPELSLFSYEDPVKTRFYLYVETTGQMQELLYYQYLDPANETRLVSEPVYKSQVMSAASIARHKTFHLKTLEQRIQSSAYNEEDLENIVRMINGQDKDEQRTTYKKTAFYVGVAAFASRGQYHGDHVFTDGPASYSVLPKIAAGINVPVNPRFKRTNFRFELSATSAQYYFEGLSYSTPIETVNLEHTIRQYMVQGSAYFVWNIYNTKSFRFNVGAGAGVEQSFFARNEYTLSRQTSTYAEYDIPFAVNTFRVFVPVRIGVIFSDRYEVYGQGMPYLSPFDPNNTGIRTFAAELGFHFLFDR